MYLTALEIIIIFISGLIILNSVFIRITVGNPWRFADFKRLKPINENDKYLINFWHNWSKATTVVEVFFGMLILLIACSSILLLLEKMGKI